VRESRDSDRDTSTLSLNCPFSSRRTYRLSPGFGSINSRLLTMVQRFPGRSRAKPEGAARSARSRDGYPLLMSVTSTPHKSGHKSGDPLSPLIGVQEKLPAL